MTRVRIEDLPPKLRAQIEAAVSGSPTRDEGRKTGRNRREAPGPPTAYRCVACDARFFSYGRFQKHSDETRHARGEAIL